jgi:dienelactone hydrolase
VDEVIEWTDRRDVDGGIVEQGFSLVRESGVVPGVLWLSSSPISSPPPLVLLGHGGSGHKRSERISGLACWFASHAGFAALAIDGPYHGDRVPGPIPAAEYQARIADEGIDVVLDRMADDWKAAVDALGALGIADTDNLAYLGMSMGTRFGVPLAAGLGDQLRCAVFGKFGLRQGSALHKGLEAPKRTVMEARRITAPVLFHVQWNDEIFPRDGQLALFDALGSQDKQLVGFAGPHAETKPVAVSLWRDFVFRHLASHMSR